MSDNQNRVEFTREMKKDYTILTPNMAPIHFELVKNVLESFGFHVELLRTTGREIVDEGLKYVHNDTCYPAQMCIRDSPLENIFFQLFKQLVILSLFFHGRSSPLRSGEPRSLWRELTVFFPNCIYILRNIYKNVKANEGRRRQDFL